MAGIAVVVVMLAAVGSAANSCSGMFRPECERSSRDLNRAAFAGDLGAVERELGSGSDPNGRDNNGITGLGCAADAGRSAVAVMLVRAGANGAGLSRERQDNLLTPAAATDDVDTVATFLDHGFDVTNPPAERVIAAAVRAGASRVLVVLVAHGADPNRALRAAITDEAPTAPFTLSFGGPTVPPVDIPAPLMIQRLFLADRLLDLGADARDPQTLLVASTATDPGFLERLLARGADPNGGDGSPLSRAAAAGAAVNVRVLLVHGADPNLASAGPSALMWAVLLANGDIVDQLLAAHADPNFGGHVSRGDALAAVDFSVSQQRPPAAAAAYVHTSLATFVDGANVAPIVAAGMWDHWDLAAKLLASGADPDLAAGSLTAVSVAAAFNHPVTLRVLLDRGARRTSVDPTVRDPLVLAVQLGYPEVVQALKAPR